MLRKLQQIERSVISATSELGAASFVSCLSPFCSLLCYYMSIAFSIVVEALQDSCLGWFAAHSLQDVVHALERPCFGTCIYTGRRPPHLDILVWPRVRQAVLLKHYLPGLKIVDFCVMILYLNLLFEVSSGAKHLLRTGFEMHFYGFRLVKRLGVSK